MSSACIKNLIVAIIWLWRFLLWELVDALYPTKLKYFRNITESYKYTFLFLNRAIKKLKPCKWPTSNSKAFTKYHCKILQSMVRFCWGRKLNKEGYFVLPYRVKLNVLFSWMWIYYYTLIHIWKKKKAIYSKIDHYSGSVNIILLFLHFNWKYAKYFLVIGYQFKTRFIY